MRTLQDWLEQLEQGHPSEIELGLERIRRVAAVLGWDEQWKPAPKIVTVAGTNGKGSTLGLIEQVLIEAGIQVGSYTSPHLVHYNERVRINGVPASDESFCAAFERVEKARGTVPLTYFEAGTLAAFQIISAAELDIALLEIGLGGRLDAVNLVSPDIAIITGIALDHMDWLGDNREAIGAEKAGILRPDSVTVIGDPDPPDSVMSATRKVSAPVVFAGREFGVEPQTGAPASWWGRATRGEKTEIGDLPPCELHPAAIATAVQAVQFLETDRITQQVIRDAIASCSIPGRCQRFTIKGQSLVVDVSHNPQAAEHLARHLVAACEPNAAQGKHRIIVGMLRDKAIASTIAPLDDWADEWIAVPTPGSRGMSASQLAEEINALTGKPVTTRTSPTQALQSVLEKGEPGDSIVGFGSFSVAGALLQAIADFHNPD